MIFQKGGVFCNFEFGLREKIRNFDFPERGGYSATSNLDLGKNLEIWIFQRGGVFCNFEFGLREKLGNLDFPEGGYSATSNLDLGKSL